MTQPAPQRFRSLLFVPGNRAEMLQKSGKYPAHGFIPDLEDSVPAGEKATARETVAAALPSLAAAGRPIIPRVNSLPTGLTADDIAAVVTRDVTAVSIGKVSGSDDIREVDSLLAKRERELGVAAGTVGILPWIESAKAVMSALEIATVSPRVRWLAFGAEDFAADMGIARAVDSSRAAETDLRYGEPGLIYARSAVTVAARAAGVWPMDTPFVMFRDPEGLKVDCTLARRIGFRGKLAIHPAQVEMINAAFAPSEEEVARARRVLEAAAAAEREGRGSLSLDGEMVDAPVIARAKNVLADAGLE